MSEVGWMPSGEAQLRIAAFPFATLGEITGDAPVLILAPHPDDESLACGGLIAACNAAARRVDVAILTDGAMSHPNSPRFPPGRLADVRAGEARSAVARLGLPQGRLHLLAAPDGHAPHEGPAFNRLTERIVGLVRAAGARTLITSWIADPHGDHVSAARLARAVVAQTGLRLLFYPVWAWTLAPDVAVPGPVTGCRFAMPDHLPAKRRAIAAHASQNGMIDDDPTGFVLPGNFLALFDRPWEAFIDGG